MPELSKLLHNYVESTLNVFTWVNPQLEIDHIYSDSMDLFARLPYYFHEMSRNDSPQLFIGFPKAMQFRQTVKSDHLWVVDRETFSKHSFYNEIMRPAGVHVGLHRPIYSSGKPEGALMLYRAINEPEFTKNDAQAIDRVARHLQYALSHPASHNELYSDIPTGRALVTLNSKGEVEALSENAERMIGIFLEPTKSGVSHCGKGFKQPKIFKKLAFDVQRYADGISVSPPYCVIENKWGRFRLIGYYLNAAQRGCTHAQIMLQVDHFLPSSLIFLNKIEDLEFTERQKDICIQIGLNKSYDQIGDALGIAKSTVVSHKKEIFKKIKVKNRHEFTQKLLYS